MMRTVTPRFVLILAVDVLLLIICLYHLPSVFHRATVPFDVMQTDGRIAVSVLNRQESCGALEPGDNLLKWDSLEIPVAEAIEFLADLSTIGKTISITFERAGEEHTTVIELIPYYLSPRFLVISIIVGALFWLTGVLILLAAPPSHAAAVLHWTMIAFAVSILTTLGAISADTLMSYVDRILFYVSYVGVVALFVYFTFLYPTPRSGSRAAAGWTILSAALVLMGGLSYYQILDLQAGSIEHFAPFQLLFDIFHASMFLCLAVAVFNLMSSLKRAESSEDRKKLQWILWGLTIGSAPFLFLQVLPQILISRYLIPEEYSTIFFLAVPFSFSMSFLKYRLLDIEVLINRSIVYVVLSLFIVTAFGLIFLLTTTAFGAPSVFEEYLVIAALALAMALVFGPVRDRLQNLVDETLFPARANYRTTVLSVTDELHLSLTPDMLYHSLVERLYGLIPVNTAAAYYFEKDALRLRAHRGMAVPRSLFVPGSVHRTTKRFRVLALSGVGDERSNEIDRSHDQWLVQNGFAACAFLTTETGEMMGTVMLSLRRRGDVIGGEEVDLLSTVCAHASEILERLRFQERMILEHAEKTRLQELSDVKTYFVSSVSHELRMPLTSIRMFAETLRGRKLSKKERTEYLQIIEGESERLSRLIENILDFSKIERGVKEYAFSDVNVGEVVRRTVKALEYQFKKHKAVLRVRVQRHLPVIVADADALEESLLNLLSNALKYSVEKKDVTLDVKRSRSHVTIEVSDKGIGIPKAEVPMIFGQFYRVTHEKTRNVGGTGLGLPVVKHFVDAHNGTITVRSKPGHGSTFILRLPISQRNKRIPNEKDLGRRRRRSDPPGARRQSEEGTFRGFRRVKRQERV